MNKKNESIMYLYKAYLTKRETNEFSPDTNALKKGILINKKCNKKIIDLAINIWGIDGFLLNQTFHKSLGTVVKTTKEDLLIQQIIHYLTTYGYEELGLYNKDTVFIPKEKLDIPEIKDNIKLTQINPITKKDLKEKLWNLLTSSIPLSSQTIEHITNLSEYLDINNDNIEKVTNKEVKIVLYKKLNIIPKNNVEFLRYLVFILTNNTLLIKSRETKNLLRSSDKSKALELIKKYKSLYSLIPLAEIFNRFKPLFLSLKSSNLELNKLINKISKLSKKNHKPYKTNDLDNLITWYKNNQNKEDYLKLFKNKIQNENIWRIIKLRNYININNLGNDERVYKIRNGKVWVSHKYHGFKLDSNFIDILDEVIINKLKPNVSGKKVFLDNNVDICLPQSEKQFVCNIPFSSSIELEKDNLLVGIHWYNVKKSRVDLDLKIISDEYQIGWDCSFKEGDKLVFSGDVTDAPYPNGASEYIYIDKSIGNTIFSLKVNNYTMNLDDIEYDIIIAKSSKGKLTKNYVVDPNDIIIKIPKNAIEKTKFEHSLGNIVISDNKIKIIFTDLKTSNRRSASNNEFEKALRNYLREENNTKCKLKDYLVKAGAIIKNNNENVDIDLSINNLDKNKIIELLK